MKMLKKMKYLTVVVILGILTVVWFKTCPVSNKPEAQNEQPDFIETIYDPIGNAWPGARIALNVLRLHESWDGRSMTGDCGRARGWLHQHEAHWYEGCEMVGVDWPWPEDTNVLWKCEVVAVGYWMRYARSYLDAGDVHEMIRRFRLPNAPYRPDNDRYLEKVLKRKEN